MTINDQIRDEKLQYVSIEKQLKYGLYYQVIFKNKNILLMKIYCHLINSK